MNSQSRVKSKRSVSLFEIVTFLGLSLATGLNPGLLAQTPGNQPTQINRVLDLAAETGVTIKRSLNEEGIAVGQDGEEISRTFH